MKIAVVLFNLGGPSDENAVRPFLFNLFKDKNIIRLPAIIRYPLGYLISTLRYKKASKIYAQLGGKSPINQETQSQVTALENMLNTQEKDSFKVFYCMQYWHPMHPEVVDQVAEYAPDEIILLPLYPQFSSTTTKSSLEEWFKQSKEKLSHIQHRTICCYPENTGFIHSYGNGIIEKLKHTKDTHKMMIIYSAHGIPQDCVDDGDPYEEQVQKTTKAIQAYLKSQDYDIDHILAYQSKVGPKKWLEPDTESMIEKYAQDKRPMIIVPLAFTSEHSETLVELDKDYKELALNKGCPEYLRVPTVSSESVFIEGLKQGIFDLLEKNMTGNPSICSQKMIMCPKKTYLAPCIHI